MSASWKLPTDTSNFYVMTNANTNNAGRVAKIVREWPAIYPKTLHVILDKPTEATKTKDDPLPRKLVTLGVMGGYSRLVVFSLRQTDLKGFLTKAHERAVAEETAPNMDVLIAWGDSTYMGIFDIMTHLKSWKKGETPCKIYALGKTAAGNPVGIAKLPREPTLQLFGTIPHKGPKSAKNRLISKLKIKKNPYKAK